jgi:regulator of replication initiation timing
MSILDNAKGIASAIQKINNPDLCKRVLALYSDIVGLVEENIHLRDENHELKEKIRLKGVMKFQEPF